MQYITQWKTNKEYMGAVSSANKMYNNCTFCVKRQLLRSFLDGVQNLWLGYLMGMAYIRLHKLQLLKYVTSSKPYRFLYCLVERELMSCSASPIMLYLLFKFPRLINVRCQDRISKEHIPLQ